MHKTYQHQSLKQSDESLNYILDIIVEGIWDWNANTRHVNRSPGWYRMLGYPVDTFKEDVFTWENIIHPDDYDRVMSHFEDYISHKTDKYEIEYRCKKKDGSYLWIVDRAKVIATNSDGSVARMIGAHHNIHEQKTAQLELIQQKKLLEEGNLTLEDIIRCKTEELEFKNQELSKKITIIESISNMDPLTRVGNRKKFERELSKEIMRANRYNHPLSLTILDIDFFKDMNDQYGHKVGDNILCELSQIIASNIRDVDIVARWGGDEFVIIFPELTEQQAYITCEKLRKLIHKNKLSHGAKISCSFGISQYQVGDPQDTFFKKVDDNLFKSKESGRNSVYS